jgi:hypothetical protein
LKIKPSSGLYREINPDGPEYVGTPTPEIDAAWSKLIHREELYISNSDDLNV